MKFIMIEVAVLFSDYGYILFPLQLLQNYSYAIDYHAIFSKKNNKQVVYVYNSSWVVDSSTFFFHSLYQWCTLTLINCKIRKTVISVFSEWFWLFMYIQISYWSYFCFNSYFYLYKVNRFHVFHDTDLVIYRDVFYHTLLPAHIFHLPSYFLLSIWS